MVMIHLHTWGIPVVRIKDIPRDHGGLVSQNEQGTDLRTVVLLVRGDRPYDLAHSGEES